jgi:hypothetical protein
LLAGLFSPESGAREEWLVTIQEQRLLLERAQQLGAWKRELKPLYKALSELRAKLHPFGLEIASSASSSAYTLMALPLRKEHTSGCRPCHYASHGSVL